MASRRMVVLLMLTSCLSDPEEIDRTERALAADEALENHGRAVEAEAALAARQARAARVDAAKQTCEVLARAGAFVELAAKEQTIATEGAAIDEEEEVRRANTVVTGREAAPSDPVPVPPSADAVAAYLAIVPEYDPTDSAAMIELEERKLAMLGGGP